MSYIGKILRGMIIGLANIIPGVSGGTMMVSMGIYDTLIHSITHLFKEFRKSVAALLPYVIGMAAAILALSFVMKWAFANYPLPTNTLFVGLILGSLPAILKMMKARGGSGKPVICALLFLLSFGLLILQQVFQADNRAVITLNVLEVIKLFLIGCVASATMVIPGVSGSMILKLLGYYEPIVTEAIPGLVSGLRAGDWAAVGTNVGILLPFGLGIVIGIFAIAKLVEVLMAKYPRYTYMVILGLVAASPVVILLGTDMSGLSAVTVIIGLVTFAIGYAAAWKLGGEPESAKTPEA